MYLRVFMVDLVYHFVICVFVEIFFKPCGFDESLRISNTHIFDSNSLIIVHLYI